MARSAPDSSRAWRVISASTLAGSEPDSSRVVTSALAWIQRCWRRAASYSRAFSTATPAAAPKDTRTASSSSGNSPPPRDPQDHQDTLFVLGDLPAAPLAGQIQVAEHHIPDPDRDAQEAVHRRVASRGNRRRGGPGYVGQAQRPGGG